MPSGAHASHQNHGRKPKRHCRHDDEIAGIVQQLETIADIFVRYKFIVNENIS